MGEKLRVGHLDADHRSEKSDILPRAFVMTQAIEDAFDDGVCFVCGRKGAGKTAIAEMLISDMDGRGTPRFEASIVLREADYRELHDVLFNELTYCHATEHGFALELETLYVHLWEYILDLLACRLALELPADSKGDRSERTIIGAYVKELWDDGEQSAPDVAAQQVLRAMTQASESRLPLTALAYSIKMLRSHPVHRSALAAALSLLGAASAVVVIDTLESYDVADGAIYPLRGMCRAVKQHHSSDLGAALTVKCLLPAEMTDGLFRENLAKFHEVSAYVLWTYSDLLELLARRWALLLARRGMTAAAVALDAVVTGAETAKGSRSAYWRDNFWATYFPMLVTNKYGWQEDACAYLLRHTQKRPREVISCLNHILKYTALSGEFPNVSEESLVKGIHDPDNLYQLLSDNLAVFNLPRTEKNVTEVASDIMAGEHVVFSGKDFSRFAKRAMSLLSTEVTSDSPAFAQNLLLRSGLVGRVRPASDTDPARQWRSPGADVDSRYYVAEFEYLVPGYVAVNDACLCAVHPVLGDRLGLRQADGDTGVVYPLPESDDLVRELTGD